MFLSACMPNRRNFLTGGVEVALGFATLAAVPVSAAAAENAWGCRAATGIHARSRNVDIHAGFHA